MKTLLFSFWILTGIASATPENSTRRWVTNDFFIEESQTGIPQTIAAEKNCREHIKQIMCLVDPPSKDDPEFGENRPCLPGSEDYAVYFEHLYDHYPDSLQKMFCSLDQIFIEKEFFGTAYAGLKLDKNGNSVGAMMGIRKSVLDENLDLNTWATWKEQLSFGGITDSYRSTEGLPSIRTGSIAGPNDFLYFVVTHEFGHIFDFANRLNRYSTEECTEREKKEDGVECEMHSSSWGAISWLTNKRPKPEHDFPNRSGLCFYWCEGNPLGRATIPTLYDRLYQSSFISIYATTQAWDDFADSLAYFMMMRNLGTTYTIDTNQGHTYDIIEKLKSPQFAEKLRYLEHFVNRSDIHYP